MSDVKVRVIDMFGSLPTPERLAFEIRSWGSDEGYGKMFRDRWSLITGIPGNVIDAVAALPARDFRERAVALVAPHCTPVGSIVAMLEAAGVRRTVVHNLLPTDPGLTNDDLAEATDKHAGHFIRFARVDPTTGPAAAAEVRRCVTVHGFQGATITPFWHNLQANDSICDPLYSTCQELGIPIWIHTSVNWVRKTPLNREHPLYLDDVATRYPDLTILAGHAGWPWIADMVAVAWRHPNVYIDISAFRPKHVATTGTGWEMLWYYMQRTLKEKVVFGTTWTLLGSRVEDLISEACGLGLDERVRDLWLYRNACRVLGLD